MGKKKREGAALPANIEGINTREGKELFQLIMLA